MNPRQKAIAVDAFTAVALGMAGAWCLVFYWSA